MSKAKARRLAKAAAAERTHVPELAPGVAAGLESYRPWGISEEEWARVRPQFLDMMRRCRPKNGTDVKKYRTALGPYLAWRHEQGLGTALAEALTFVAIDDYYSRHLLAKNANTTANDYRSILRRLAQRANPGLDAPTVATVGHQPVRPGYTPSELAAIVRVALRQRRPQIRRRMCAFVGLCAGAGLGPEDFRHLIARCIADLGADGIRVDVPGARPRTVWVRADLEHVVRAGLEGLTPNQLVLGRDINRRNITPLALRNADLNDCVHPEAVRLRSTWLSWLMCQPVPLAVILDAAGLTSVRTLSDLVPTLPRPQADSSDLLRRASHAGD